MSSGEADHAPEEKAEEDNKDKVEAKQQEKAKEDAEPGGKSSLFD